MVTQDNYQIHAFLQYFLTEGNLSFAILHEIPYPPKNTIVFIYYHCW